MKKYIIKFYLWLLKIRCYFNGHSDNYFSRTNEIVRCSKCGRIDMGWTLNRWLDRDFMKFIDKYL